MDSTTRESFESDIRALERKIEFSEGRLRNIEYAIQRGAQNEDRAISSFERALHPTDPSGRPEEIAVHIVNIRDGLAFLHQTERAAQREIAADQTSLRELRDALDKFDRA